MIFNLMKPVPVADVEPDEPTATKYSYNGVELPALPEWDKEMYPYAYIHSFYTSSGNPTGCYLCVYSKPCVWGVGGQFIVGANGADHKSYHAYFTSDTWGEGGCVYEPHSARGGVTMYWSNIDIPNPDGNGLFLAATEPIPIYE